MKKTIILVSILVVVVLVAFGVASWYQNYQKTKTEPLEIERNDSDEEEVKDSFIYEE
jgi:glucan phosphoethanolaminetransferase (alkaline phosphatase superfamily)